tara:strand:+ start:343 stop:1098 length:756 start_codon:yes stop_codon:yes gene_type:complete
MKVRNQAVKDIAGFIKANGLDPVPTSSPTSVRRGDERLVTETYSWGQYQVATRKHIKGVAHERWAWVGGPEFKGVPRWARALALEAAFAQPPANEASGPTERARQRLSKRSSWRVPVETDQPESVRLAHRCVALISARCRRTLASSQASSRDGELFVRDHYNTSKYLSVFVRRGENIAKLAQIWPLARTNAFHVQLQGLTQSALRDMIPPQYEVVLWSDRKPRVVVKSVDEVGISYVARAVAKRMEAEDAL